MNRSLYLHETPFPQSLAASHRRDVTRLIKGRAVSVPPVLGLQVVLLVMISATAIITVASALGDLAVCLISGHNLLL
jgi:hypothetical protein